MGNEIQQCCQGMVTVLDWLRASTLYSSFEDMNLIKIAMDRGVDPNVNVYDDRLVSKKEKDLMEADLIFTAILKKPSNTASLSQSHNGFQQTIGGEHDFRLGDKIRYAISIYRAYGDPRGDILETATKKKIKFIRIVDVDNDGNVL